MLLDVLTDTEIVTPGIKPRDLYRITARGAGVLPESNSKLQR